MIIVRQLLLPMSLGRLMWPFPNNLTSITQQWDTRNEKYYSQVENTQDNSQSSRELKKIYSMIRRCYNPNNWSKTLHASGNMLC